MSKMFKNGYFGVLTWGHESIDKGISYDDYLKFVEGLGNNWGEGRKDAVFRELFSSIENNLTPGAFSDAMREGGIFHLSVEASFRHLEMVELIEARQSSRTATWIAIIAIILTALMGIASIYVGLMGPVACG